MCLGRGLGRGRKRKSFYISSCSRFLILQTANCTGTCLRATIVSFGWLKSTLAFRAISHQPCDAGRNRPRRPGPPPPAVPAQALGKEREKKGGETKRGRGGETHTGGWRRAKQQNHHHSPVPTPPPFFSAAR